MNQSQTSIRIVGRTGDQNDHMGMTNEILSFQVEIPIKTPIYLKFIHNTFRKKILGLLYQTLVQNVGILT